MASLLTARGVRFEHHDVLTDDGAAQFLAERGIKAVPVIVAGDETVIGFDEARLARVFGIAKESGAGDPDWLAAKFELIFDALARFVVQLGAERLDCVFERRRLSVRTHVTHIITFAEGALQARETGGFEGDALRAALALADDVHDPAAIATYARDVSQQIGTFLRTASDAAHGVVVRSHYGGEVSLVDLLAIMLRHSTHHLLQLVWLMEHEFGLVVDARPAPSDLAGITLPADLFGV